MDGVVIESARLNLRTFTPRDADEVFACITPAITRFMSWEPPASPAAFAKIWRSWLSSIRDETEHYFVVRFAPGDRCLGIVALHALKTDNPELGIWLRVDSHGRGFGGEAIRAVAAWASEELQPSCFEYPAAEESIASRRIAESLGGSIAEYRSNPKYNSVVYRIPRLRVRPEAQD
jgi:RimJ/RimL family protein N-acetyltransferase